MILRRYRGSETSGDAQQAWKGFGYVSVANSQINLFYNHDSGCHRLLTIKNIQNTHVYRIILHGKKTFIKQFYLYYYSIKQQH